jgi:predicted 3-demethylubiquinone-9 3-methyltransferase (glyoxalase superfamily)
MKTPIISTCLWFDSEAAEAAALYKAAFPDMKIIRETGKDGQAGFYSVTFEIGGHRFMAMNGGRSPLTPAISFSYHCRTVAEVDELWQQLSTDGMVMMPLQQYDWNERYGFLQDRFGVSWQLFLNPDAAVRLMPCLLFPYQKNGDAVAAMELYTKAIPDSEIKAWFPYPEGEVKGNVMYGDFLLHGQLYSAMDSGVAMPATFTDAVSLLVQVADQEKLDKIYDCLVEEGEAAPCGWLKDRFGVWWQVVPADLGSYIFHEDKQKAKQAMAAMLQMQKIEISKLQQAIQ